MGTNAVDPWRTCDPVSGKGFWIILKVDAIFKCYIRFASIAHIEFGDFSEAYVYNKKVNVSAG